MSWFAFWGKREEPKVNPLEAALLELESTRKKLELMEAVTARQLEYMRAELERAREEFAKAQAQVQELQQKAEQAQQAAQQAQQAAQQAQQTAEQADQKAEDAQQQAQQDVQIPPTTEPPKKKGLFGRIFSYLKELIDKEYEEIRREEEEYQKKGKKDEKKEGDKEKKEGDKKKGEGKEGESKEGEGKEGEQEGDKVSVKINTVQAEVKQAALDVKVEGKDKEGEDSDEDDDEDDEEDDEEGDDDDKKKAKGLAKSLAKAAEGFSQAGSGLYKMSRALFGSLAVLPVALGKAMGRAVGDAMVGMWKFLEKAPIIGGIISSTRNFMGGLGRTIGGLVKGVSGIVGALKSLGSGIPGMIVDGLLKLGIMVVNGVQDLGFYLGKVFFDLKNAVLSFFSSSYEESLKQAKDKASRMPSRLGGGVTRESFVKPVSIPQRRGGGVSGAIYQLPEKQRMMLRAQEAQGLGQFREAMEYSEGEAEEDMWGGPELRYDAERDEFMEVQAATRPKPTMVRTSRTFSTFTPPPRQYRYVEGRFAPPRPSKPPVEVERKRDKKGTEARQLDSEGLQVQVRERTQEREERRSRREQTREVETADVVAMSKAITESFQLLGSNMMAVATILASAAQILANMPKGSTMPTPMGGGGGGAGTPP